MLNICDKRHRCTVRPQWGSLRIKLLRERKIVLDGNDFYDCTFNECRITYRGGDIDVKAEAIRCHWVFDGAAKNTINLLRNLGLLPCTDDLKDRPVDS